MENVQPIDVPQVVDLVSQHLVRYEALVRIAGDETESVDLLLLLSDINDSFRGTLDRLAT